MTEKQEIQIPINRIFHNIENKEHVLRILDWEINRIDAQTKKPGWTVWAVYGAICAIGWTLLEQLGSFEHSFSYVLIYYLLAHLGLELLSQIASFLQYQTSSQVSSERFFKTSILGSNRYELAVEFILSIILIVIATYLADKVTATATYSFYIYYGASSFLLLSVLVLSFFKWPVPLPSSNSKAMWIIPLIRSFMISVPIVGYFYSLESDEVKIIDLKVAALAAVLTFLVMRLVENKSNNPLFSSLIDIRRKLSFGHVTLDDAIKQAEIAMVGMNIKDVLQEDVKTILDAIEKINQEEEQIEFRIKLLRAEWPLRLCEATEEQREKIISEIKSWVSISLELKRLVEGNSSNVKILRNKINFLETYLSYRPPEIEEVVNMLIRAEDDSKEKMTKYKKTFLEFSNMVEQPCPERP